MTLPLLLTALLAGTPSPTTERARVIIETDAGGDPDDEQSLVRFLLYANEWDVEGIIANRPTARPGENLNPVRTGLGIVRRLLDAYGQVVDNLRRHDPRYPARDELWARTVSGYADSRAAVDLLRAAVDRDDPRPIWFQNWGTDAGSDPSSLERALDEVLAERGPEGYARFKSRLRLCSDQRFGRHTFDLAPAFPLWIDAGRPEVFGQRWYRQFGPLTAKAGGFDLRRDALTDHGPLGALYPTNTGIAQKEGDSAYFIYLIPTGMNDPEHPEWGAWSGRYAPRDDRQPPIPGYWWATASDTWQGTTRRDNVLARWAADLQNDFRARLDWCVQPPEQANHRPLAVLNGDSTGRILHQTAAPGDQIKLSAAGSHDPDGDALSYTWWCYGEAGSYRGPVRIDRADTPEAVLHVPADAAGQTLHLLLTLRDNGDPPLAGYRRLIVTVGG